MRLATVRTSGGTRGVRVEDDHPVDLGVADIGELLDRADWRDTISSRSHDQPASTIYSFAGADFAPVVPHPSKIICVGQNYRNNCQEGEGRLLRLPTLFPKAVDTVVGAFDEIAKPAGIEGLDWNTSLAIVLGHPLHRANEAVAAAAIAGFTVLNDVSLRDSKFRPTDRTQSRIWDHSTPVGPWLMTPESVFGGVRPAVGVRSSIDGAIVQDTDTTMLLIEPVHLVRYISQLVPLAPGDIIATSFPRGPGHAHTPKRYLGGGEVVVSAIHGIGACDNRIVEEA